MSVSIASFYRQDGELKHDIYLDSTGSLATVNGPTEVAGRVSEKLLLYRGDVQLDQDAGLPYFSDIFQVPGSLEQLGLISQLVTSEVSAERGVAGVSSVRAEFVPDTQRRELDVTLEVTVVGFPGTEHIQVTIPIL